MKYSARSSLVMEESGLQGFAESLIVNGTDEMVNGTV